MVTIVEFLTARLDEAERPARLEKQLADDFFGDAEFTVEYQWARMTKHTNGSYGSSFSKGAPSPEFILADIAAKRAIVEVTERWMAAGYPTLDVQLRILASVYSDHPDYRQEWKP